MTSLAFSRSPAFAPAPSDDPCSSTSHVQPSFPPEIPIDPALSTIAIDPALEGDSPANGSELSHQDTWHQQLTPEQQSSTRDYSQGPHGDPFAQPPDLVPYYPAGEPAEPHSIYNKKARRRRKPKQPPEENCGYCQGSDSINNWTGKPEALVTCDECSRSGHPYCMKLSHVQDQIRTYPWLCQDCKVCEVCARKGDEKGMAFCDVCDKGWHMACLRPPLEDPPEGAWSCPDCPPLPPDFALPDYGDDEASRQASVAATEETDILPSPRKRKRSGKSQPVATDQSDVEVHEESTPGPVNGRGGARRVEKVVPKRGGRARSSKAPAPSPSPPATARPPKRIRMRVHTPPPPSPAHVPPRVKLRLRPPTMQEEGPRKGLFDDVLNKHDRDTSKTNVLSSDRERFDVARQRAEENLLRRALPPPPPLSALADLLDGPGPSTRATRASIQHHYAASPVAPPFPSPLPGTPGSPTPSTPSPYHTKEYSSPTLRIRTLRFGGFDIQTWYDAPFPEEYNNLPNGRLWMCEFCLKYDKSRFGAGRHDKKCRVRHPPGDEIYRDGSVSIFEVDGRKNKIFCQNLCLLSKMFLDHKSLFYDVEPFLFYVLTETVEGHGAQFVGYFSKEKLSPKNYNVSCIMTLPIRQRKGWGNLLIDFSYLLSKKEGSLGTPERPLSGHGKLAYTNYWTLSLMRYFKTAPENPSLEDIAKATSMEVEDICEILEAKSILIRHEELRVRASPVPGRSIKYSKNRKGQAARGGSVRSHLVRTATEMSESDSERTKPLFVQPSRYEIHWDPDVVTAYMDKWEAKGYLTLKPEQLKWTPFLADRTKLNGPSGLIAALASTENKVAISLAAAGLPQTPTEPAESATPAPFDRKVSSTSPREKTPDNDQVAADAAFAMELANTPPTRLTRSRSSHNTPARPPSLPRRTADPRSPSPPDVVLEQAFSNSAEDTVSASPPLRTTRRSHNSPETPQPSSKAIEDDEAFAARLAAEEEARSHRQTRSTRISQTSSLPLPSDTGIKAEPHPRMGLKRKRGEYDSPSPPIPTSLPRNGTSTGRSLRSRGRTHPSPPPTTPQRLMATRSSGRVKERPLSPTSPSPRRRIDLTDSSHVVNGNSSVPPEGLRVEVISDGTTASSVTLPNGRHSTVSDTTLVPTAAQDSKDDMGPEEAQADAEVEEDAEGEVDDEDAEGEIDDGYGDEDAEGEADSDAEGELDIDEEDL